jgi:hypothetical protein
VAQVKRSLFVDSGEGRLNREMKYKSLAALVMCMVVAAVLGACSTTASNVSATKGTAAREAASIEEQWGIKVVGIRLTARGYYLDFRYKVIDPDKALPLLDRSAKPYIIDEATGAKSAVPEVPKVGSLKARGTPKADHEYFMFFGTINGLIKKGSRVTVVVGDFRAENLVVE